MLEVSVKPPPLLERPGERFGNFLAERTHYRDRRAHFNLQNNLIEHIWPKFGSDFVDTDEEIVTEQHGLVHRYILTYILVSVFDFSAKIQKCGMIDPMGPLFFADVWFINEPICGVLFLYFFSSSHKKIFPNSFSGFFSYIYFPEAVFWKKKFTSYAPLFLVLSFFFVEIPWSDAWFLC